jgi:hypothetical protein
MGAELHGVQRTRIGAAVSHTPGPWEIVSRFVGPYVISSGDGEIAHVGGEPNVPVLDNVRLIAAAPDLLAALKLACEELDIDCPMYFDESELAGKIRAAIAKAEGK